MKKLVIFLIAISAHSQYFGQNTLTTNILSSAPNMSATLRANNVFDPSKNNNTIEGSPYNDTAYKNGKVENINAPITFRYNAYRDAIEFKEGTNIFDLPKEAIYSPLSYENKKIVLLEENGTSSYYIELYSGYNYSLFKKDKINLIPAKESNGYNEGNTSAKFSKLKSEYFYKNKDNTLKEFPKNKKSLFSEISINKDAEAYVNKNSNFIKDENKLIELVKLINNN